MRDEQGQLLDQQESNELPISTAVLHLDEARPYPNPYRVGEAINPLMFGNLPQGATIHIFDVQGHWLQTLTEESGFGGVSWDLKNHLGKPVASGVYIYRIRAGELEKNGKLMIIR